MHFQACIETTRKVFKWNIETKHEQKKSLSFAIQIAISRALFSVVMECLFLFLNEFFPLQYAVCVCLLSSHACMRPFDILKATRVDDVGAEADQGLFSTIHLLFILCVTNSTFKFQESFH